MTSLKKGILVNDGDSVCNPTKEGEWSACIICQLSNPVKGGTICLNIMAHAGKYWITEDPFVTARRHLKK